MIQTTTKTKTLAAVVLVSLGVFAILASTYYYGTRVTEDALVTTSPSPASNVPQTSQFKIQVSMTGASTCESGYVSGTSAQCGLKYISPLGTQAGVRGSIDINTGRITVKGYGEFTGLVCTNTATLSNVNGVLRGSATCSADGRTYRAYGEGPAGTISPSPTTYSYRTRATFRGPTTSCDSSWINGTSASCAKQNVQGVVKGFNVSMKATINPAINTITVEGYAGSTRVCTSTMKMTEQNGVLKGEASCVYPEEEILFVANGEGSVVTISPSPTTTGSRVRATIVGPDACDSGWVNGTTTSCAEKHVTAFEISTVATVKPDERTVTVKGYDGRSPSPACTDTVAMTSRNGVLSGKATCTEGQRVHEAYGEINTSASPTTPSSETYCDIQFSPSSINKGEKTNVSWVSFGDADGQIEYVCRCVDGNCSSVNTEYGGKYPDIYEQGTQTASGSTTGQFGPPETVDCTVTVRNSAGMTSTCSKTLFVNTSPSPSPTPTGACAYSTKTVSCSWNGNTFTAYGVQNTDCTYKIQAKISGVKNCDTGLISGNYASCPNDKYISPCMKCCASSWPRPEAEINRNTRTLKITGLNGQDGIYGGGSDGCYPVCTNSVVFDSEPAPSPTPTPTTTPTVTPIYPGQCVPGTVVRINEDTPFYGSYGSYGGGGGTTQQTCNSVYDCTQTPSRCINGKCEPRGGQSCSSYKDCLSLNSACINGKCMPYCFHGFAYDSNGDRYCIDECYPPNFGCPAGQTCSSVYNRCE